eukprot:CAMPEP_0172388096 /NCGR_PEP_ID=MMETSP1061-20121228/5259_1 /TAXON_ID=37318 /ORGANISM="Pseudo-nitzschia pungens, Strain cf. pungens" /LENGTH=237 /DNA_ID=CAMNT_0013117905 /DNA_START=88 /DNA_END=801 /DNA_ORIENTATION=-
MTKLFAVVGACIAIFSGYVYQSNPLIFGESSRKRGDDPEMQAIYDYTLYDHYPDLDDELFTLASYIGQDLGSYRNHCLRVLTFTRFFLPDLDEESLSDVMDLSATVIPYLHIGLWTGESFNFLESSEEKLEKSLGDTFPEIEMEIMRAIVLQQYKTSDYTGLRSQTGNALVNAVRKANWVDTTMGLIRFNLPSSLLEAAYDELDGAGFHKLIWGRKKRLTISNFLAGVMETATIVKW